MPASEPRTTGLSLAAVSASSEDPTPVVKQILSRELDIPAATLTADSPLNELGVDDTVAEHLIVAMGHELDIRFPDDFFDGIRTYADLTSAVRLAVGA